MPQFRRKPALTEATQWFKNGDHPQDRSIPVVRPSGTSVLSEGQIVKFFREVSVPGGRFCPECGNIMQKHGVSPQSNGFDEQIVHPGDYIVTDTAGRHYPMRPGKFEAMFEPYTVAPTVSPESIAT